jgi:hypothetical protein
MFPLGAHITLTVTQASGAKIAWSNGCTGTTCAITGTAAPITVNVTSTNQNIVFTTSQKHSGNFGGLAGANAYCNAAAATAGVPGNYVAFLGTGSGTPALPYNVLGSARGWIRIDGLPFTDTVASFRSNVMWYPAALDEYGNVSPEYHFTGYNTSYTCSDWTSASSTDSGSGGDRAEGNYFTQVYGLGCDSGALVCFGTDFTSAVSVTPASGRHAFASTGAFDASQGLAAADAICQSGATAAALANPTHFLAALATTTASIQSRFNMTGATWVRTDGVAIASSSANFMAGVLLAPTGVDELGNPNQGRAWLGTNQGLTGAAPSGADNCNDWSTNATSASSILYEPIWGGVGSPNAFTEFAGSTVTCDSGLIVLCLEN